jgi:MFS family permease
MSTFTVAVPRKRTLQLSRRVAFWAVAYAFVTLAAFSTAPSSLYGLYVARDGFSSLTVTFVYAVYVVGVVGGLIFVGHLSDIYGRRVLLLPGLVLAAIAALVFIGSQSLTALIVARLLTGFALGTTAATATAYIADLASDARRAATIATVANIGGIGFGPLLSGLLARYAPDALTLSYVIFLGALLVAILLMAFAPEGRAAVEPRPPYRPNLPRVPKRGRRAFIAGATGVFVAFSVGGLFAGLSGAFLRSLGFTSPALIGLSIFLIFGSATFGQLLTASWPSHKQAAFGVPPLLVGLALIVVSPWISPHGLALALFLAGAVVDGIGQGAIFRASLALVISTSTPAARAGALATFFTVGYAGLSLPVIGLGVALQYMAPRIALLIFGVAIAAIVLAAAPVLTQRLELNRPE